MSRTPKKVPIGIVEFALPVPRRGSIDALSGFGSGPQIGAEIHQRVQARRRRENPSGSVSKVEMMTPRALICKALFLSISTFETLPITEGFIFLGYKIINLLYLST